jgi:hypothetical protein
MCLNFWLYPSRIIFRIIAKDLRYVPHKSKDELHWNWNKIQQNLDEYLTNFNWPENFHWGVATSAHQSTFTRRSLLETVLEI